MVLGSLPLNPLVIVQIGEYKMFLGCNQAILLEFIMSYLETRSVTTIDIDFLNQCFSSRYQPSEVD